MTRAMENGFAVVTADWPEARHEWQKTVDGVTTRQTHYTSGATSIVDPSHRPDIDRVRRVIDDGNKGVLRAEVDLEALRAFRDYRQDVGLLPQNAFTNLLIDYWW